MFCSALLIVTTFLNSAANRPDSGKALGKADTFKDKEVGDISGYYACSGSEGIGKNYHGVAVITKKRDVYIVQWTIGAGAGYFGIAIRQGDTLAASWAIPGEKGVVRGVNMYRIEPGPRLVGRWAAIPGDGGLKTETLTFLKRLGDE